MHSRAATVAIPSRVTTIATTFDLQDRAERRIFDIIQRFYAPDEADRLRDIKRGTDRGQRMVWTLGSFKPQRRGAKVEWMVTVWNVDEIEVRMQPCKDEREARAKFLEA